MSANQTKRVTTFGAVTSNLEISDVVLDRLGVNACIIFPHPPFATGGGEFEPQPVLKILIKSKPGSSPMAAEEKLREHIETHFKIASSVSEVSNNSHNGLDGALSHELITPAQYTAALDLVSSWKQSIREGAVGRAP